MTRLHLSIFISLFLFFSVLALAYSQFFFGSQNSTPDALLRKAAVQNDLSAMTDAVKTGADVNTYDSMALRWMVSHGNKHGVIYLLDHGADATALGYQALRLAKSRGYYRIHDVIVQRLAQNDQLPDFLDHQSFKNIKQVYLMEGY